MKRRRIISFPAIDCGSWIHSGGPAIISRLHSFRTRWLIRGYIWTPFTWNKWTLQESINLEQS